MRRLIDGRLCATDRAFARFRRDVDRLAGHATWVWFTERVVQLENDLAEAGGFDRALHEHLQEAPTWFGPTEDLDRLFKTTEIVADMEEFASAFLVTLQTRLTAAKSSLEALYVAATTDDGFSSVPAARVLLAGKLHDIWLVANYIKHNDEWGPTLKRRQQDCFDTLVRLDVARESGSRQFVPWPVCTSTCKIADEDTLSQAMRRVVAICTEESQKLLADIQADFDVVSEQVELARDRHATPLRS